MILEFIFINAILTTIALYIVFLKLDILKIVGYEVWVDTIFTVGLAIFMMNTFNGIMTATVSGIALSILLRATRYMFGYKKFEGGKWVYYAREGMKGRQS